MTAANARWQLTVYGGVQHGFTEHTQRPGCAYDEHADQDSWRALLGLIAVE
jgi:dienelactone hydrolase